MTGDGALSEFTSAVDALSTAKHVAGPVGHHPELVLERGTARLPPKKPPELVFVMGSTSRPNYRVPQPTLRILAESLDFDRGPLFQGGKHARRT
jgi:hypothetical protein